MKYTKREQRAMAEKFVPKYIKKEDVKIGFRFYLRADDCGGNCGLKWLTLNMTGASMKICPWYGMSFTKILSCGR